MTDWNLMTEYIHNAMYELDKAQAATRQVQENATPETLDKFLAQIQELTENLTNLQTVLNHQEDLALDKFADWLSKEFTGKLSEYRYTPRTWRIVLSAGPEQ